MKPDFDKPPLEASFYNLPKVSIEIVPQKNEPKGTFKSESMVIKDGKGEVIGNITLNISRPPKGEAFAYLNTVNINEELRGRGYGKAVYLELIKFLAAVKLKTSENFGLSRGAYKIWEWLSLNGLAIKIAEGEVNEATDNDQYSTAEYETIV